MSTIAGFGVGGVLIPANTILMHVCPDAFIATTSALALPVRFVGGSVGNTIYFAIFQVRSPISRANISAEYSRFSI